MNKINKKTVGIFMLLLMAVAIPLTVWVSQRQQETRQRAAGENVELFFSQGDNCNSKVTSVNPTVSDEMTLSLCLISNDYDITGFDLTIDLKESLNHVENLRPSYGIDASKFNIDLHSVMNGNQIHYARVTIEPSTNIKGTLHLAKMTFKVKSTGSGSIGILNNYKITSILKPDSSLTAILPTLAYTISSPTIPPPSAPASLNVSVSCTNSNSEANNASMTLTWPKVTGATGYYVRLADDATPSGDGGATIQDTGVAEYSFTFNNLGDPEYFPSVQSYNSAGASGLLHPTNIGGVVGQDSKVRPNCTRPTATPSPTTPQPTATLTPTPTPTTVPPTATTKPFIPEDFNIVDIPPDTINAYVINIADFSLWLSVYREDTPISQAPRVDTNGNGKADIVDFNRWLIKYRDLAPSGVY